MSFLSKMTSILSNDGQNILYSNMDNFKKHGSSYMDARHKVAYQKELNRKSPDSTEQTYLDEKTRVTQDKLDYAANNRQRAVDKSSQKVDMAEVERQRLSSAHANEAMRGKDGKLTKEGYDTVAAQQRDELRKHVSQKASARQGMYNEGKEYFTGGDWQQNGARIGAATAALGTAAVATRYMSGGSATHNNQGRRDIAGIPFI